MLTSLLLCYLSEKQMTTNKKIKVSIKEDERLDHDTKLDERTCKYANSVKGHPGEPGYNPRWTLSANGICSKMLYPKQPRFL